MASSSKKPLILELGEFKQRAGSDSMDLPAVDITGNTLDLNPAGTLNNWSLTSGVGRRILGSPSASVTITGIDSANAVAGRVIFIQNDNSSFYAVLSNQDTGSAAANRFDIGTNIIIPPSGIVPVMWDASRWRLVDSAHRYFALFTQTNTVTVGNSTAEATIFGTGQGTKTIPANTFNVGKTLRFRIRGYASRTSGTLTLKFKLGGTVYYNTGTFSVNATNNSWYVDIEVTCITASAGGTVFAQAESTYNSTTLAVANTATQAFNTTTDQLIDFTVQWSIANAGNTITSTTCTIEFLN